MKTTCEYAFEYRRDEHPLCRHPKTKYCNKCYYNTEKCPLLNQTTARKPSVKNIEDIE